MSFRTICFSLSAFSLIACGGGDTIEAGNSAPSGKTGDVIHIAFQSMETESQYSGALNACLVKVVANNKFGRDVSRVSARFGSVLSDEADVMDQATAGLDEEHMLYIGDLGRGDTVDDELKIRAVTCEGLGALNLISVSCQFGDREDCADHVVIDEGGIIGLRR